MFLPEDEKEAVQIRIREQLKSFISQGMVQQYQKCIDIQVDLTEKGYIHKKCIDTEVDFMEK